MGSDRFYPEETPVRTAVVPDLWVDELPVPNARDRPSAAMPPVRRLAADARPQPIRAVTVAGFRRHQLDGHDAQTELLDRRQELWCSP
jgi:hypothetical protein